MEKYCFPTTERASLEASPIPMAVFQYLDHRVVTLLLSDGFCKLFGCTDRADACYNMERNLHQFAHPDDVTRIVDSANRFAAGEAGFELIYRIRIQNSSDFRIIHALGQHLYPSPGVRLELVWYTDEGPCNPFMRLNSSELSQTLHNALRNKGSVRAAKYDYLTGLPSMTWFLTLASSQQEIIQQQGGSPAVVFLDFQGMKYYNRKNGFVAGDKLLQGFARLLADQFGNETCSRLGQDHFAVITDEQGVEQSLNHVFSQCAKLLGGKTLPVHAGIYLLRSENVSISLACDRAKIACDAMRGRYISCFNYYNLGMRDSEDLRQYVIANLDAAIEKHWLQVYYQPIVRAVNERVCHEEALARWIDPVKGMLSPGVFIPSLEDSGILYKLDLYVLEQVLQKLKQQAADGRHLVPQSINLSRSDFDACDMVSEICARMDKSGLPRKLICIEITESVIGKDFDFMKIQIQRFQELGFSVWMDDFGSGYSSLDVLESISFDTIKFDMHFMRKLNEGDNSKIILTQLIRMTNSLGVDTICEGVERLDQVTFLKEIGCSKLQGFYYSKPMPAEEALTETPSGIPLHYEDPAEKEYFETIGRANLFDATLISNEDVNSFCGFFGTLPIGIMEYRAGKLRLIRSNHSFQDYLNRFYRGSIPAAGEPEAIPLANDTALMEQIRSCCEKRNRLFFSIRLPDDSTAHSTVRWLSFDPVTGCSAVALAVITVSPPDPGINYANIARALAADYFKLYYVNLQTEEFIEYFSGVGTDSLAEEQHGNDFFGSMRADARLFLYREDQDSFIEAFTKENILLHLSLQGSFTINYRMMTGYEPVYMSMKITRADNDKHHIIIGVSNFDAQAKEKARLDRIRESEIAYSRIKAISNEYICLYTVALDSGHYIECSASSDYRGLGLSKTGTDFFFDALANGSRVVLPADYPLYQAQLQQENVLQKIRESGQFSFQYHLLIDGKPELVRLRAGLVRERDGEKLIVGVARAEQ